MSITVIRYFSFAMASLSAHNANLFAENSIWSLVYIYLLVCLMCCFQGGEGERAGKTVVKEEGRKEVVVCNRPKGFGW